MKKIFMLTLVFLASVSFATLQAKEGKKKKGVVEQKEAVQLSRLMQPECRLPRW